MNDSGVTLVNKYAELQEKKKQLNLDLYAELEKLEKALINFAEKENVDVVFGSNNKVKISVNKKYKCPLKNSKERLILERLLKENGKWNEVAQLDTNAINRIIKDNKWDKELIELLKNHVKYEKTKRLFLSKKNN